MIAHEVTRAREAITGFVKREEVIYYCYLCIYSLNVYSLSYPAAAGQSTELDPNDGSTICILTMHHQHNPQ